MIREWAVDAAVAALEQHTISSRRTRGWRWTCSAPDCADLEPWPNRGGALRHQAEMALAAALPHIAGRVRDEIHDARAAGYAEASEAARRQIEDLDD